ncbi:hypothetical protein CVD23_10570 [Bacillus sp. V33-4]|nr:hypothetical protein CVD23_10570 [Bacillus sp. V33-4]
MILEIIGLRDEEKKEPKELVIKTNNSRINGISIQLGISTTVMARSTSETIAVCLCPNLSEIVPAMNPEKNEARLLANHNSGI